MLSHVTPLSKAFTTYVTSIGFFTCMNAFMDNQCMGAFKCFSTNITREPSFTSVNHSMLVVHLWQMRKDILNVN